MTDQKKFSPEVTSPLRNSIIAMPDVIRKASGIKIYGKRIKSIVYSLDVSLLANTDADAILCVYPFTPSTKILEAISLVSKAPILAGVGGGLTSGERSARLASQAEENNATAVVLNGPADVETTKYVRDYIDIPIIYTVIDKTRPLQPYIDAGVNIFNIAGGKNTVELVKWVRDQYPDFPIIASGGNTDQTILATIEAGANAITYTAFGQMESMFHKKMDQYRQKPSHIDIPVEFQSIISMLLNETNTSNTLMFYKNIYDHCMNKIQTLINHQDPHKTSRGIELNDWITQHSNELIKYSEQQIKEKNS